MGDSQVMGEANGYINKREPKFIASNYSGDLNTEHWNTEQIGVLNVSKFCFPVVQKQDGRHRKTKLMASLDHFIYKHKNLFI